MAIEQPDPEERRKFWGNHIEKWQQSNCTQADYCRQNGITGHQFTYWKKRLVPDNDAKISFVPLQLSANLPVPARKSVLNLFTSNGYKIEVSIGFDPVTLKQLIIAVQSL